MSRRLLPEVPRHLGNPMRRASFRMGRALLYRLDAASQELHSQRSAIVRQAVSEWLRQHGARRSAQ